MMSDRVIVPEKLQPCVLETLHLAHQGVYMIMIRAQDTVYWPGLSRDIERIRAHCLTCQAIAPLQSNLPPVDPIIPEYPFQHPFESPILPPAIQNQTQDQLGSQPPCQLQGRAHSQINEDVNKRQCKPRRQPQQCQLL